MQLWSRLLRKRTVIRLREHCYWRKSMDGAPEPQERKSYVCCSMSRKRFAPFAWCSEKSEKPALRNSCCAGFRVQRGHGKRSFDSNGTSVHLTQSRNVRSTKSILPRLLRL